MRMYTRIIFGLNFLYQLAVGVMALFTPETISKLYGVPAADSNQFLTAAFRALGANIILGGVISAYIAVNPDKRPILLRVIGILAALTLIAWGLAYFNKEMTMDQIMVDVIVQLLILVAVAGYRTKALTDSTVEAAPQA